MKNRISRREFIKKTALLGGGSLIIPSLLPLVSMAEDKKKEIDDKEKIDKIIAVCACSEPSESKGKDPSALTLGVLGILGGMKQFVKKDDVVLVKPNIGWEKKPELAATTNPDVIATIVKEALNAGAKKVKVLDRTCQDARRCYRASGIEKAAKDAGAEVVIIEKSEDLYQTVKFPKGKVLKSWDVLKEALNCNVFINVPIAKHHGLTKLTLGIKNLLGVLGGRRADLHNEIDEKLADVLTVVRPHLTIIDAYRVLVAHGPQGGNEKDVKFEGKIIAGVDIVAVDAYAATLKSFGELTGEDIDCISTAAERGLGEMDLTKLKIVEKKI